MEGLQEIRKKLPGNKTPIHYKPKLKIMTKLTATNEGSFLGSEDLNKWNVFKAGEYQGYVVTIPNMNQKQALEAYRIKLISDF